MAKDWIFPKHCLFPKDLTFRAKSLRLPPNNIKITIKKYHIEGIFNKYIRKYVGAVVNSDMHILNSAEYRHTTLQNYHFELGI